MADDVKIKVGADTDQADKALRTIPRRMEDVEKSSRAASGGVDMLKSAMMGLAAYVGFRELKEGISSVIQAASDLQEVSSKFSVVFAGQEATANAWAETLVDSYAMSTREAKQYLASVQDLLVPMGMQAEAAGKMSNEVVKLSADLGSFNNLPTAQVMDDIQSALVGNYETMKKYGVVLNASTVQQKAMSMGLARTKDDLTAADKAQAAYALMVEGSTAAIGDMARTSNSYANQAKKMGSTIEDLRAEIGKELIPVATSVVKTFNDWVGANRALINQKIHEVVGKVEPALKKIWDVISYDPAIMEWGLVGLAVGGRKGAVMVGSLGHMVSWASNLARAMELAGKGMIDFGDIASANFKELENLIAPWEGWTFGGETHPIPKQMEDTASAIEKAGNAAKDAGPKLGGVTQEIKKWDEDLVKLNQDLMDDTKKTYDKIADIGLSEYERSMNQIDRLAEEHWDAGADEVALAEWVAAKKKEVQADYANEIDELNRQSAREAAEAELEAAEELAEQKKKIQENFLKEVQGLTADVFRDIAHGQIRSMEDAWDRVKDYALDVLSEIAAKAVINLVFTSDESGALSGLSGLLGGGSGSGGGSNQLLDGVSSLTKLYNGAKSAWSSVSGWFGGSTAASATEMANAWGMSENAYWYQNAYADKVAADAAASAATSGTAAAGETAGSWWGSTSSYGTIAAIIALQHSLTGMNDRVYEGQATGDVFSADFMTEPWWSYVTNQFGWDATAGEKFDAATSNQDWGAAAHRFPSASLYWADPVGGWENDFLQNTFGDWGFLVDPLNSIHFLGDWTSDLFGGDKKHRLGPFQSYSYGYGADENTLPWAEMGEWHVSRWGADDWAGKGGMAAEEVMTSAVTTVHAAVDEYLATMPEEMAADLTSQIESLRFVVDFGGKQFNLDRFEAAAQDFWTTIYDAMMDPINEVIDTYLAEKIAAEISDLPVGIFDAGSSVMDYFGDSGVFTDFAGGDYSRAEGVTLDDYSQYAVELAAAVGELEAAWTSFSAEVDAMFAPLTSFESAMQSLKTWFDESYTSGQALGMSEEYLAKIREREVEATAQLTQQYADARTGIFGDIDWYLADLTGTITDVERATQAVDQQFTTWEASLLDNGLEKDGQEHLQFLDMWAQALDAATLSVQDATAAAKAQEAAQRAAAVASERAGLERQLLELQGDTEAIRDLERAALDESNQALYDRINALKDEQAAQQAAKAAREAAQRAAEQAAEERRRQAEAAKSAAIAAQVDIIQESADAIRSVFDLVKNEAAALYGESAAGMTAAAGSAFIDDALSAAIRSGALPDADRLSTAIDAVKDGLEESNYASAFGMERDRLVLAGKLTTLQAISGDQLTEAERQIAALESIDDSVQNVEEAVRALGEVLSTYSIVPQFAAGGYHTGGIRLVGESGPELEVTGPAMYYSAGQTAAMMGGGDLAGQVKALREDNRAQARTIAALQARMVKMMERWDADGMPEERVTA